MTEAALSYLCEAVRAYPGIFRESKRCEGLLRDYFGKTHTRELNILLLALKEQVPQSLDSHKAHLGIPLQSIMMRLERRLTNHYGIEKDLANWAVTSWAVALELQIQTLVTTVNRLDMQFALVPEGTLIKPRQHDPHLAVQLASFWMLKTPVTQSQWMGVMGENPSRFEGSTRPVESVSWHDVQNYLKKLNHLNLGTYRLPTEDEWEYACRAGSEGDYCFGNDQALLGQYAWYHDNSKKRTQPVAQKKPNAWGLYDMHGNVWEWCQDSNGNNRVVRGGSCYSYASYARCVVRCTYGPDNRIRRLGFRLVRSV